jgi:hypothetical protein
MLCDEVKELLYEYIFEELPQDKKLEIEEHLKNCTNCEKEYIELKKLLIDDMQQFNKVKEALIMPKDLPLKVKNKLYGTPVKRFSRFTAAACLLLFLFYTMPVAAYYIVENTALNKYISFDKGLIQNMEKGEIQPIDKSSTMKDITFRVDGIIRKADRTTILFTVKVPKNMDINYAMTTSGFNTVKVEDQFGKQYHLKGSGITLESAKEDGEATAVMDVEPLKPWAYKLTMRITALEGGILESKQINEDKLLAKDDKKFNYTIKKVRNIYGKWEVKFYIDRSHK